MRLGKFSLMSIFRSSKKGNVQSTEIAGNNNTVTQTIIIEGAEDSFKRDLLARADTSQTSLSNQSFASNYREGDDREEIKRIIEYRQLADEGQSSTALTLLKKLATDERFSTGYFAFRLHYNIGIVQQQIGEIEEACFSLRTAHSYYPEDPKSQTGLALAELLDGAYKRALEQASELLKADGDHRKLAACICYHAAKNLGRELDCKLIGSDELTCPDVLAAYLEYLRKLRPTEYENAITTAYADNPENDEVATMWALSILENMKRNQAFLLGEKMASEFEENVDNSAIILRNDLEKSLSQQSPNKLLLPSQANNAAVALRLSGSVSDAGRLVDRVLELFPEMTMDLAQIRAVLFVQEDKEREALELLRPFIDACELQVLASEIEAQIGEAFHALSRINKVLKSSPPENLLSQALAVKARIGINALDQHAADEALEELMARSPSLPELVLLRSAYDRAFTSRTEKELLEQAPAIKADNFSEARKLLASLREAHEWDFSTLLQAADELLALGYFRECTDLLRDRVSLSKESPALKTLCDACLHGHLGSLAREISDELAPKVKNSVFGWKFCANVAYLGGEIAKAVPLTRKLFERNPRSLNALEWYVQSLLRSNDRKRIQRVIKDLDDWNLSGTLLDRWNYVKLLVFCGEIVRARTYAYRLFCENQNDNHAWMALSSSVLAFGRPPGANDDLDVITIQESSTFEVLKPTGEKQFFTIESDEKLLSLRDGNIPPDHPVALAALGRSQDEHFDWPFQGAGKAEVLSVKHKTLAAFHMILAKFEERFPEASSFKSVSVNFEAGDGLDEMKAMLKQRSDYAQSKAREYHEGAYPIYILGYHLGIDPIDALVGLKAECGVSPKVSSCSHVEQNKAHAALKAASKSGIIADAAACYLLRRLEVEKSVEQEFGPIGITQQTIDIFSRRLQETENSIFVDTDTDTRKAGSMAIRDGQIVLSELTEEEANSKVSLMQADLEWLKSDCVLIPSVAKTDPNDAVIRFRRVEGGRFFEDIFAADGSGRVLISDDFHLRQWAEGLFQIQSAWLQELLFYLEATGKLSSQEVIKSTVLLLQLGEESLSTSSERVLAAVKMLSSGKLSEDEFVLFCSVLGQAGADMRSHIDVTISAIFELWRTSSLVTTREKATGVILRCLLRHQGENARIVLDVMQKLVRDERIRQYIAGWRIGHFLT